MLWFSRPQPAPPAFGKGKVIPEKQSSYASRLVFHWLDPILWVGYTRPLEHQDLWELPPEYESANMGTLIERQFYSRCPPSSRPIHLRDIPDHKTQDSSLLRALHRSFIVKWWVAAILKLASDTLITTAPLINNILLKWLVECYVYHRLPSDLALASGLSEPRGIGYGIGLAFGLFAMREVAVFLDQMYSQIAMTVGMQIRTGIVSIVHRKALRLSGRARQKHSVGQIITLISKDSESFEQFAALAHLLWISPIQIIIGLALLIKTLGYSAVAGFGIIIAGMPILGILLTYLFEQRKIGSVWTDKRVRSTSEVIQGIRLVKFFGWESFYKKRISNLREGELKAIRNFAIAAAALMAIFTFLPIGATMLSFITYALTDHELDIPTIFTALQFLGALSVPMIMFPVVLSFFAQLTVSLKRTSDFLLAEELENPYDVEEGLENAVEVDASFVWEVVEGTDSTKDNEDKDKDKEKEKKKKGSKDKEGKKPWFKKSSGVNSEKSTLPQFTVDVSKVNDGSDNSSTEETPFALPALTLRVPKGSFQAIVGGIGSGKSSILEALVGEMRRTDGQVKFSGPVAYVPQRPWIRNQTLKENIMFGQPFDEERYRNVIHACCLEPDIVILPQGDMTEIGEKGINLSGGQKARVSLARAAYSECPIVLLDDPLSAVDAHVGQFLLDHCLLNGPLANRTRLLVTHALHVLPNTEHIYMVDSGNIVEQGSYEHLSNHSTEFSRVIQEYGSVDSDDKPQRQVTTRGPTAAGSTKEPETDGLMQDEERLTGAVDWQVYMNWFQLSGGIAWAPVLVLLLVLNQGSQVLTAITLGWWTSSALPGFKSGHYMALYAALGGVQALFSFLTTTLILLLSLVTSRKIFHNAIHGLLHSPISFFDTTPAGRILSRLSKDQDAVDTRISLPTAQFLSSFTAVFGTIALVAYVFPYLTLIFIPLGLLYYYVSLFYRATSVETKRLDSILRSSLYAAISESLTGLSTLRAFGRKDASVTDADNGQNTQNQAYFVTISIQRWLAIRLDTFGNILVLGIGIFAAGFRKSVDPSKIGVVLSYTLQITQILSGLVTMMAQVEQAFNAVERLIVYGDLTSEGDRRPAKSSMTLPQGKNAVGSVVFRDVELAYRPGLPLVLKGVSFDLKPGEKVGVIGRTGGGKSSLIQALFRIVELQGGKIEIDGVDTSKVDLHDLRTKIALVPQESPLFYGDIRQNIDPEGMLTDAELLAILRRTGLLPEIGTEDPIAEAKFGLDSAVGDEGINYSAGEKQLIALCRALAKKTKIIVLDEATSSVDAETDAKIQRTIRTEFQNQTLLCIAHRIGTIASYDRVLVMDQGRVAECDTVLELYDRPEGSFRHLCIDAGLTREDVVKIRKDHHT